MRHRESFDLGVGLSRGGRWVRALAVAVAACCVASDVPGGEEGTDTPARARASAALTGCSFSTYAGCWDFDDPSGTLSVRVYQCHWRGPAQAPQASCPVEADYALVGGGAEIFGEEQPGAMLTASYPGSELIYWYAASKDHYYVYPHYLRAYAIGLKLAGVAGSTLRSSMYVATSTSGPASQPEAVVQVPPGFLMIGGGARTSFTAGQLLYMSKPYSNNPGETRWQAKSKDHIVVDHGYITAYAIAIPVQPPGYSRRLAVGLYNWYTPSPSGYSYVAGYASSPWITTSVGGFAGWYSAGRLLSDLFPLPFGPGGGVLARSKDHQVAEANTTFGYNVVVTSVP